MNIVDPRTEYTADLLGTEATRPHLSWRIESTAPGLVQTGYRIRAAASADALASGPLLWDSGHVQSEASFDVAYGGPDRKTAFFTECDAGVILKAEMPHPGKRMYSGF